MWTDRPVRDDAAAWLRVALERAERRNPNPVRAAERLLARLRPRQVTVPMFTGDRLRVVLPELVAATLHRDGYIEAPLTRAMLDHLRPGMTFVDVGAQYGYHTLLAARLVGSSGHVLAFEPTLATFTLLAANTRGVPGIELFRSAVGETRGAVELHDFGARHSALNSVLADARVPERERRRLRGRRFTAPLVDLDSVLESRGLVADMVKIDAESAELRVLRGMERTLRRSRPLVTVETGDYGAPGQPSTRSCIDHLTARGYRCMEYDGGLRPHTPRASYGYGNLFFAPE